MHHNIYLERRANLIKKLGGQDIGAVVITDPVDIIYFTGVSYHVMERLLGLVLKAASGQAVLVLPAMEKGRLQEAGIEEIGYADNEDAVTRLAGFLKNTGRIGLQKASFSLQRAEKLAHSSRVPLSAFIDISQQVSALRLYKDETEIASLRHACAVTDRVLAEWKQYVRPGINERALRLHLDRLLAEQGVQEACPGTIIASGIHSSHAHGLGYGRDLCAHEPVYIDCGARWAHYYCDITRTFFTGRPGPKMEEVYQVVLKAQEAAIAAVRPGRPLREIDAIARRGIQEAGYGAYFTHRTGHGVGLDVHEPPQVGLDSGAVAGPGMAFTVEPGVYLPGLGGVRIEDDVLVTEDGAECLTRYPKDLEAMIL